MTEATGTTRESLPFRSGAAAPPLATPRSLRWLLHSVGSGVSGKLTHGPQPDLRWHLEALGALRGCRQHAWAPASPSAEPPPPPATIPGPFLPVAVTRRAARLLPPVFPS